MTDSEQSPQDGPLQPTVEPRDNPPVDEERLKQAYEALAEVSGH